MTANKGICRQCILATGQSTARFDHWWDIGLVRCSPGEWHNIRHHLMPHCRCYMENVVLGQEDNEHGSVTCGNNTKSAKAASTITTPCGV